MMDRNLRTRLQAARWLLEKVATKAPDERIEFLRSETDDHLLIELVEGLLENESPELDEKGREILLTDIKMEHVDAVELLREINGIPRRLGDFDLSRPVGRGGMGSVFLAEHRSTGVRHAVKVAVGDSIDCDAIRLLHREAEIMQDLEGLHGIPSSQPAESVVREEQVIAYYPREFIRGIGIEDWITAETPDLFKTIEILIDSGRTLQACHEAGIAHGDIKPSNILLGTDERTPHLIDFGLSVRVDANELVTRTAYGHPAYTAPEIRSTESHDPRLADQFSMGLTMFALLRKCSATTQLEMPGEAARMAGLVESSHLPNPIRKTLQRMTELDPGDRFPSMDAAMDALRIAARKLARSRSDGEKSPLKRRILTGFAASAALLLAGTCGWLLQQSIDSGPVTDQWISSDLNVAMEALDAGDVAMATQVLSSTRTIDDSWLARHVRARIQAIYANALIDPNGASIPDSNNRFETLHSNIAVTTRDVESGQLHHRWPAEPSWLVQHTHANGAFFKAGEHLLNLDIRKAAAANVVTRDAVEGSLFSAGDNGIGWINHTGSIVITTDGNNHDQQIPLPNGLIPERTSIASDGWTRLVVFDGGPELHVIGLGPQLGNVSTIPVEPLDGPVEVIGLGTGHFLIYGQSSACLIIDHQDTIRTLNLDGPVRHVASTNGEGALILVHENDSSVIHRMSSTGRILAPGQRVARLLDAVVYTGEDAPPLVFGPSGVASISGKNSAAALNTLSSLANPESMLMAGPRSILLGGPWNGLWVFDPVSRCLRGHINTGGEEVKTIMGATKAGAVFTQDQRGFIRRIPA